MNLARIEYYFADFLSIMEMPDIAEWKIDLVSESLPTDPKNIVYGKLLVPQNVWFVGTANNDDSTFTITDKVYDRAVALSLNEKAGYFDAPVTESYSCNNTYLESLFTKAWQENAVSAESLALIAELDDFLQKKFKIAFGNRIMKQLKLFVPVYVACGGTEAEGIDFMLTTKILRKFNSLNLPFLIKELGELIVFIDKKFGKGVMKISVGYIRELQKAS
jgi:5-methylcytosine-specific restriction endonuclease McrBC GTP-binding regulatory subunit McrB